MKKQNKYKYIKVLQGLYYGEWCDLCEYDQDTPSAEIKADYKAYQENETGNAHRVINRRVLICA